MLKMPHYTLKVQVIMVVLHVHKLEKYTIFILNGLEKAWKFKMIRIYKPCVLCFIKISVMTDGRGVIIFRNTSFFFHKITLA